jgi:hypothetical protein
VCGQELEPLPFAGDERVSSALFLVEPGPGTRGGRYVRPERSRIQPEEVRLERGKIVEHERR